MCMDTLGVAVRPLDTLALGHTATFQPRLRIDGRNAYSRFLFTVAARVHVILITTSVVGVQQS